MPAPRWRPVPWLLALIETIEGQPWSPAALACGLAAIIAVRNLLEIRVGQNPVFTGLAAFVHYPLAYVAPFLALTLVLAAWSGVRPHRVARLMLLAWLLTLAPPLVDVLAHPGVEKPVIGYLQADPSDLARVWTRFFDPRLALAGTTVGIRVETLAAVVLGAVYVALRSRRAARALGAAVSVYVASLFFFSLPVLVTGLFRWVQPAITMDSLFRGEGVLLRGDDPANPDRVALFWLVPLLALLALAWRRLERDDARREPAPSANPGWLLAPVALAGLVTALWLHFPAAQPLVYAAYDALATLGLVLAILFAGHALVALASGRDGSAWLGAAAAGVLALGLGRSAAVGLVAMAGALAPLAFPMPSPRARTAALVVGGPFAALSAFVAGYALVVGPEALARVPLAAAALPFLAGLAIALARPATDARRAWWWIPGLALLAAVGVLLAGSPRALLVAAPLGAVAGVIALAVAKLGAPPRAATLAAFVAAGFAVLVLTRGLLANAPVREPWARQATCVPRLDIVRGQELERAGKWGEAESAYRKALDCDPENLDAMRGLGLGWVRYDRKIAKGTAMLEQVARKSPDSALDLNNLAGIYLQQDRAADALPLLEKALRLEPDRLQSKFNFAQALEDLGRRADAARAWTAYIEGAQRYPDESDSVALARRHVRALGG